MVCCRDRERIKKVEQDKDTLHTHSSLHGNTCVKKTTSSSMHKLSSVLAMDGLGVWERRPGAPRASVRVSIMASDKVSESCDRLCVAFGQQSGNYLARERGRVGKAAGHQVSRVRYTGETDRQTGRDSDVTDRLRERDCKGNVTV